MLCRMLKPAGLERLAHALGDPPRRAASRPAGPRRRASNRFSACVARDHDHVPARGGVDVHHGDRALVGVDHPRDGISPAMTLQKMQFGSRSATRARLSASVDGGRLCCGAADAGRQPALRPPRRHLVERRLGAQPAAHQHQPGAVRLHAPRAGRGARHRPAWHDGARRRLGRRAAGGGVCAASASV